MEGLLCSTFAVWRRMDARFIEEVGGMSNIRSNMTVPNANVRSKAL
jgi:hypothetical protein